MIEVCEKIMTDQGILLVPGALDPACTDIWLVIKGPEGGLTHSEDYYATNDDEVYAVNRVSRKNGDLLGYLVREELPDFMTKQLRPLFEAEC